MNSITFFIGKKVAGIITNIIADKGRENLNDSFDWGIIRRSKINDMIKHVKKLDIAALDCFLTNNTKTGKKLHEKCIIEISYIISKYVISNESDKIEILLAYLIANLDNMDTMFKDTQFMMIIPEDEKHDIYIKINTVILKYIYK